jgi:hypothetical protein
MGFADRMVHAENRPLHKTEPAFGCVDVNKPAKADIFAGRMIDGAMA